MILSPMRAAFVVLACSPALAQSLPDGWTSREVEGGILYSPARLPPGMQYSCSP
jgi:hypothetical protein